MYNLLSATNLILQSFLAESLNRYVQQQMCENLKETICILENISLS